MTDVVDDAAAPPYDVTTTSRDPAVVKAEATQAAWVAAEAGAAEAGECGASPPPPPGAGATLGDVVDVRRHPGLYNDHDNNADDDDYEFGGVENKFPADDVVAAAAAAAAADLQCSEPLAPDAGGGSTSPAGGGGDSSAQLRTGGDVGHCRVCGDEATGMYFGALVCVPCKVRTRTVPLARRHCRGNSDFQ